MICSTGKSPWYSVNRSMGNQPQPRDFDVIPAFMPAQVQNLVPVGEVRSFDDQHRQASPGSHVEFMKT
jgi:hypothetical protein